MTESPTLLLLPATGFLRISEVLRFIPVGKTTWWMGVKDGIYPQPVKISERVTAWRAEDILELINRLNEKGRKCA